jgi:hypothetical protein
MTLADLVGLAPVEGATYFVDASGLVSVKQSDGIVLANKHQLDADDLVTLATARGPQQIGNRIIRVTKPGHGFRIDVQPQTEGLRLDRIDPAEAKNIAAGYGNGTQSEHVFNTFVREVVKPRISRDLNAKELDDLAAALAWDNSIYDPTLTLDEYLTRLEGLNPELARALRS